MYMVVNYLGVHFQSKHLRQNKKKLSFSNNFLLNVVFFFEDILNGSHFYPVPHIFQHIPFKMLSAVSASRKETCLCFLLNGSN